MNRLASIVVASVLSCLLTVGLLYAFGFRGDGSPRTFQIQHRNAVSASNANYTPRTRATEDAPFDFTFAAERVGPAVVHIANTMGAARGGQAGSPDMDMLRQFFGPNFEMPQGGGRRGAPQPRMGSGSGVLISDDGYIVTNNHVINDAIDLEVRLDDGRTYKGTLVGTDPTTDIALVKIEVDKKLPFVEFGSSDDVRIGEWVAAVGNPFDLETTVTAGIISAKGRSIDIIGRGSDDPRTAIESFIQTDAAVNPGNSGGALVDLDGKLIGINTAIASMTGSYAGYSFAVPGELAKKVTDDLREFGTVQRGFIGASIIEVNPTVAEDKELKVNYGVYIEDLTDKSSAREAGLKVGDVITAVDDNEVRNNPQLLERIGRHRPGDVVKLSYNRDGSEGSADVTLRSAEGLTTAVKRESAKGMAALGIDVEDLDDETAEALDLAGGVRVTDVRSGRIANQTDMADGFIITEAGDRPVNSVDDFKKALASAQGVMVVRGVYEGYPGERIYAFDPN